jgi:hypothetical protein
VRVEPRIGETVTVRSFGETPHRPIRDMVNICTRSFNEAVVEVISIHGRWFMGAEEANYQFCRHVALYRLDDIVWPTEETTP